MSKLPNITKSEQVDIIAQHLPANECYQSAFIEGSVLRKILEGLASQWLDTRTYFNNVYEEWNPENTTQYVQEWESVVGIPNDCIPIADTIEQRRQNILLKLAGLSAETESQIITLANILGLNASIIKGVNANIISETLIIPFIIVGNIEAPYTIVINIAGYTSTVAISDDLIIPFTITDNEAEVFACLINKIKQSYTLVIINYT